MKCRDAMADPCFVLQHGNEWAVCGNRSSFRCCTFQKATPVLILLSNTCQNLSIGMILVFTLYIYSQILLKTFIKFWGFYMGFLAIMMHLSCNKEWDKKGWKRSISLQIKQIGMQLTHRSTVSFHFVLLFLQLQTYVCIYLSSFVVLPGLLY